MWWWSSGTSPTSFFRQLFAAAGRTTVVIDQRGVGSSDPALECPDLRALLLRGPNVAVDGLQDREVVAQLYRSARSSGLTVRSGIDCMIAAVALRTGSPVLARNRDFEALAQLSDLVVEHPQRRR